MSRMRHVAFAIVSLVTVANAQPVVVRFEPPGSNVAVGQTFNVNVVADIPETILGWGLDLTFDTTIVSVRNVTVGSSWFAATSFDGDRLAGLAFPGAVSGSGVVLATVEFTARRAGSTSLSARATPGDFTEGFPFETGAAPSGPPFFEPDKLGGFADVDFRSASITVTGIPGPTPPLPGDVDRDGDVDQDDLNLVLAARNSPASGPNDPRDLDGDGMITALDARKLVTLCTRQRCARQ